MLRKKKGKEMTGCLNPFKLSFIKEIFFYVEKITVILNEALHFKGLSISSHCLSQKKNVINTTSFSINLKLTSEAIIEIFDLLRQK